MNLQPYLMFPGNCREALQFYARCLGGSIEMMQTIAESHLDLAPEHGDRIFHSMFRAGNARFMASDSEPGKDLPPGRNFALFLAAPDEDRQRQIYEDLAEGGKVIMPLSNGLGMVEDRFEVRWMVTVEQ